MNKYVYTNILDYLSVTAYSALGSQLKKIAKDLQLVGMSYNEHFGKQSSMHLR